jgi:hypothetical protein
MRCSHDLAERETACADGMCPICAAVRAELAQIEIERLRALLQKLEWKSIDKDNMEYSCRIPYNVMDELRAMEPKP